MIDDILKYNETFVEDKKYEQFITSKYPEKKIAIVSCMDTRLTELLPSALGIKNGDAKFIKNAGGVITHPFGSVMRSLIIGIYELGIEEILVIGHTDCGAKFTNSDEIISKMLENGVPQKNIDLVKYCGVNWDNWIGGFNDLEDSIKKSVDLIRNHLLISDNVAVHGLIIDSITGKLEKIT
ncbi:MAG: beta-class carbonic anhydrase [Lachnospirales bacterium]